MNMVQFEIVPKLVEFLHLCLTALTSNTYFMHESSQWLRSTFDHGFNI